MTRINTNVASIRGLRNLQKSNDLLNTSLTRLSTGLKINSGKDNPSGLIASERLRLQITSIEQSISNSNRANNVISTADAALGEIGGLLNQVRGLVQEGINDGAISAEEKAANQQQIDAALSAINKISSNTSFAGDKLLDGSKSFVTAISTADAAKISDFKINEAVLGSNTSLDLDVEITQAAEKAVLQYDGGDLTSAATIEIGGSDGNEVIFLGDSSSLSNIKDAINGVSQTTGVEATILDGYTAEAGGTASTGTLGSTADAGVASTLKVGTDDDNAIDITRNLSGTDGTLGGTVDIVFTDPGGNKADAGVVVTDDGSGNKTINVTLGYSGGAIDSTAQEVIDAINNDAEASQLVTATLDAGSTGTNVVAAAVSADLTGGVDPTNAAIDITRVDVGSDSALEGAVEVVFADPSANNATLGVEVATDANGTSTITVNLATDGAGAITSTAQQVIDAINNDTEAAALVEAEINDAAVAGNTVSAVTATALTGGTDNAGTLEFSDARVDRTGGDLSVNIVSSGETGSNIEASVVGNDITFTVGDAVTQEQLAAAINGEAVEVEVGTVASTAKIGTDDSNAIDITRNASGTDAFLGGTVDIVFADPDAAKADASVLVSDDGSGNTTITVTLGHDGTAVDSTAQEVIDAINNNAEAAALVTASLDAGSTAGTVVAAAASTDLTGGAIETQSLDLSGAFEEVGELIQAVSTGTGSTVVEATDGVQTLSEDAGTILALESSDYGSNAVVNVSVLNGSFNTTEYGNDTYTDRDTGDDIAAIINGQNASGNGLEATIRGSSLDANISFEAANNVVGETATISITGGGSLFQIGEDVSSAGQIGIGIEAVNTARLGGISGKLYELGTGKGKSLQDIGTDGVSGTDLVNIIDEALDRVSTLRGRLGSIQKNVIETNISTLGVALENISEARSQITDTDFATETANMTRAQILSQAGTSILSIANQNPQQVLSLLG